MHFTAIYVLLKTTQRSNDIIAPLGSTRPCFHGSNEF